MYLSVKIRPDDEIDAYNEELFKLEKVELQSATAYQLIDMIKECIEKLMQMNQTKKLTIISHPSIFTPSLKATKETPMSSMRALEKKLNFVESPN